MREDLLTGGILRLQETQGQVLAFDFFRKKIFKKGGTLLLESQNWG